MKNLKTGLAFIAIMFAVVAAFAFNYSTTPNDDSTRVEKWFVYNTGNYDNPMSYSLVGESTPPECSIVKDVLCGIFVAGDGGSPERPDADELANLQTAIATAESTDTETGVIHLRQ